MLLATGAGRAGRTAQGVKCCPPPALNGSLGEFLCAGKAERPEQAGVGLCWPLAQVSWSDPDITHLMCSSGREQREFTALEGKGKYPELAKVNEKPEITSEV